MPMDLIVFSVCNILISSVHMENPPFACIITNETGSIPGVEVIL
jgi:hypothetical protein